MHNQSRKDEKSVKKHIPWSDWVEIILEKMGFWKKMRFGLKGVQERQCEGSEEIFKKMSHLLHKNWKYVFFVG